MRLRTSRILGALPRFLAALVLGMALAGPSGAATVRPVGLDEMIDTATTAFQGTCIENRTELDPRTNLVVTYTTFAVEDVLKGSVPSTHTIKQLGGTLPGEGLALRVEGIPTFVVGESYVVFLAGVSEAGFSSPIGLTQGKFAIRRDAAGQAVTVGRGGRDGEPGVSAVLPPGARAPSGRVGLDDFKKAVRDRVGGGK